MRTKQEISAMRLSARCRAFMMAKAQLEGLLMPEKEAENIAMKLLRAEQLKELVKSIEKKLGVQK